MALLSASMVSAYFVFLAPATAEAGFIEVLTNIFKKSPETEASTPITSNENLQSLYILNTENSEGGATGGSEIIIEDSTIVSEASVTPAGTDIYHAEAENISVYEIRKGDTLSEIASMFGVSVNTIKWANNLNGPIKEGQILTILPITGIRYTVKKGDTVASIAKAYKADVDEIKNFNSISGGLTIGQMIIIPDAEAQSSPTKSSIKNGGASLGTGYFTRPIKGGVRTQGIHGHNGVDLASYFKAPIYAAAGGEVIISKANDAWNGGYGRYVVIKHPNGVQTLYSHLQEVFVMAGQSVSKGEQIGSMGNTGKSTGVHLHFEVRGAKNPF
jgi:LysM repeat protein